MVTLADVEAAREVIRDVAIVTPMEQSRWLSALVGGPVWLKCENLQRTGSFKIRGGYVRISRLTPEERARGVVAASAGNHAQGVALAAQLLGIKSTVFMPEGAPIPKERATRAYGADVVFEGHVLEESLVGARRFAEETGAVLIHPFDHVDIVAGQGTLGVELMQQAPDLDAVFVSVGGGGLVGGLGTAIKRIRPQTRIVGVWPENSAAMLGALEAGAIIDVEERDTLSDGTAGAVEPGSITFLICQAVIDDRVTVSEAEIAQAMRRIAGAERWMVEGAAGVALAGLVRQAGAWRGRKVAVVLCGRNIALDTFIKAVAA